MDKELLKQILLRVTPLKKEIIVPGYDQDVVKKAVKQLIEEGVLFSLKGRKMVPMDGNYTIQSGSTINVKDTGESVQGYEVSEWELRRIYKVDRMGNEIE